MSIKSHVAGTVSFTHYQAGNLWYRCEDGFEFPVPIVDTDGACFKAADKGMYFMRWIRKHVALLEVAAA